MTITQVKEINEKIIELTTNIYHRKFYLRCNNSDYKLINGWLSFVLRGLEAASTCFTESYVFETKQDLMYANINYEQGMKWINDCIFDRERVKDDIPLEEISLWIDLFALVY